MSASIPPVSWYYKNGSQISAPLQPAQLKQAVAQGYITAATEVRQGESGAWYPASQIPGLLTSAAPPNLNVSQAGQVTGQVVDKTYLVTKTFAENTAWKTGLFRIAQLLVVAFEVVFLLYAFSYWISDINVELSPRNMPDDPIKALNLAMTSSLGIFFKSRIGFALVLASLVAAALAIAVLEIAVSTGKMVDYLRKE